MQARSLCSAEARSPGFFYTRQVASVAAILAASSQSISFSGGGMVVPAGRLPTRLLLREVRWYALSSGAEPGGQHGTAWGRGGGH